jgi:hypothetical protein
VSVDFKARMREVNRFRRKLRKHRVGLPMMVTFEYERGTVVCTPKEKKWVVTLKTGKQFTVLKRGRNDVTKHRARFLMKAALAGLITSEPNKKKQMAV